MVACIKGKKLTEVIEKLLEKMIELGYIKGNVDGLAEKVAQSLEAAYPDEDVPLDLFQHSAELKKLMSLIICASLEKTIALDHKYSKFTNLFDTDKLAKALFSIEEAPEQARRRIFLFALALMPPAPGMKKQCEDLAELLLQPERTHGLNKYADELEDLFALLADQTARYQQYAIDELNFVQAFGASPDGSPVYVFAPQLGNENSAQDITPSTTVNKLGYLNIDNSPNNLNLNAEVAQVIEQREESLEGFLSGFFRELVAQKLVSNVGELKLTGPTS